MPIDASIPLSYKPIDGMANLSSLLDTRKKMLELNKSTETYDSDVAKSKAESSTAQSASTVNLANIGAMIRQRTAESSTAESAATVNAANVNPLINAQAAATSTAQTGANKAGFDLQQHKVNTARQAVMELTQNKNLQNQDPNTYDNKKAISDIARVRQFMLANGHDEASIESIAARLMGETDTAGGVMNMLKGQILAGTPSSATAQTISPTVLQNTDGQRTTNTNVNPLAAGGQGAPVTKPVQQQLPPNTPTINPKTLQPGYIGPNASPTTENPQQPIYKQPPASVFNANNGDERVGNVENVGQPTPQQREESNIAMLTNELSKNITKSQRGFLTTALVESQANLVKAKAASQNDANPTPGFVASGPVPGQSENIKDNVDSMNKHYAGLSGAASDAQLSLSLTGNIKALAKKAITGKTADKASYFNGLANALGVGNKVTGDLERDSDMLKKEMAQFNMSRPASSDAMQTLINAGRPNVTMKDSAIEDASDQFASQIKANLAVRRFMTPHKFADGGKGDSVAYNKARIAIEEQADPRIFQLEKMTQDEKKTYLGKLTQSDRQDLVTNSRALHNMGLTK